MSDVHGAFSNRMAACRDVLACAATGKVHLLGGMPRGVACRHRAPVDRAAEVDEMSDPAKVRKHAERVRELVASLVRTQIKDPRLGMVTITDARITGDLREATVFYTVLGDAEAQAGTAAALESAKGKLRGMVGRAMGLRHSPSLAFVLDNVQDHAKEIDDLLAAARHRDAEVQRLAAGARYAGDAQPYRLDADVDADTDVNAVDRVAGDDRVAAGEDHR